MCAGRWPSQQADCTSGHLRQAVRCHLGKAPSRQPVHVGLSECRLSSPDRRALISERQTPLQALNAEIVWQRPRCTLETTLSDSLADSCCSVQARAHQRTSAGPCTRLLRTVFAPAMILVDYHCRPAQIWTTACRVACSARLSYTQVPGHITRVFCSVKFLKARHGCCSFALAHVAQMELTLTSRGINSPKARAES